MAVIRATHELHERRKGRNVGVGLLLTGFIGIVFGLTVVKISSGTMAEKFDHVSRPALEMQATEGASQ